MAHDNGNSTTERHVRDLNVRMLGVLGAVSVLVTYLIVVATQAWFNYEFQREYEKKAYNAPNSWLQSIENEARFNLQVTEWVSQEQGIVRVPIEEAMQYLVRQERDKRRSSSAR